ncbi:DsbE family thiol:disulfide interchange protein [Nevskia soli]|uniref:DsbE family thiol:disulfide interchange protein n=1 Tax=Nevskia soli TaxID=418856 RepID=UPI00068AE59D|nr:DsbE family thiol:disulfide interchange protein [Nevskia soli]
MRYAIPLVVLVALIGLFIFGLQSDPRLVPSPLIGKAAPAFDLPTLDGQPQRMSQADLQGAPVLVNFFASWCAGCQEEHPYLMQLSRNSQVKLVGIDYKDAEADLRPWLTRKGNPYGQILTDLEGRAGIDWGVYGVPETFVLDAKGTILYKQVGPMTPEVWEHEIQPLLKATS